MRTHESLLALAAVIAALEFLTCKLCTSPFVSLVLPGIVQRLVTPVSGKKHVQWGKIVAYHTNKAIKANADQPNIILILCDDLGINDISGGIGTRTPNIDSIAAGGVTFSTAYAGHSTCSPSRAALLTGKFPSRMGYEFTPLSKHRSAALTKKVSPNNPAPSRYLKHLKHLVPYDPMDLALPANETMIAEVLQGSGYETFYLGKWDSGAKVGFTPRDRGYDESLTFLFEASHYLQPGHPDIVKPDKAPAVDKMLDQILPSYSISHNNGPAFNPEVYMTDYLSQEAAALIRVKQHTPAPFFITVAYNAPHNPYQALRSDYDDPELAHIESHMQRVYAAMIKAVDRGVGTILQALRDSEQLNNTLVVFTSDNGGARYAEVPHVNAPFRGWKCTFFEGGLRVPLLMQWPARLEVGQRVVLPVAHVDLFATIGELGARRFLDEHGQMMQLLEYDRDVVDGHSLFPLMLNPGQAAAIDRCLRSSLEALEQGDTATIGEECRRMLLGDSNELLAAMVGEVQHMRSRVLFWRSGHYRVVRVGDWKLQVSEHPPRVWFHHLRSDPTEQRNLAAEVGVHTEEDLLQLLDSVSPAEVVSLSSVPFRSQNVKAYIIALYLKMQFTNSVQHASNWPVLVSNPVYIDIDTATPIDQDSEYVYWDN